ncbi:MAG: 3-phosphoshikimate 1-carboxyvinyltransferase [Robiginitomaculum sp.]|nr:MAG: 3-phosphoshikimate 1-carboxyvinyltransferase [Robiginitomaculum sp.]
MISSAKSQKIETGLSGRVRAPGDKSVSHRSLILGALAEGTTEITGLLEGDDIMHTAEAVRAFGAKVKRLGDGHWQVTGRGERGWRTPKAPINFGNAGTGARLVMGAAAGYNIKASYVGDASLSSRPMERVLTPLREMGAEFETKNDQLPLKQTKGGKLKSASYTPPHASAQVKSAVLLAGLNTDGVTELYERSLTRDHTENMLAAFGADIIRRPKDRGQIVTINGPVHLKATQVKVPGDPSSAAFLIAAGLMVPGSDIVVENVMMNDARSGLFEVLNEMGAFLRADNFRRSGGETIADLHVKHSRLNAITVMPERVPSMVDEYPILAVIAATARGTTVMRGLAELRVKESDRLAGTLKFLSANGVEASIEGDTLSVTGGTIIGGAKVKTHHDHRMAMSALILGLASEKPIVIDDVSMIATSFPDFFSSMAAIGAPIEVS